MRVNIFGKYIHKIKEILHKNTSIETIFMIAEAPFVFSLLRKPQQDLHTWAIGLQQRLCEVQTSGLCRDFLLSLSLGFACGTEKQSDLLQSHSSVLFFCLFYGASSGHMLFSFLSLKSPLNSACQTPGRP